MVRQNQKQLPKGWKWVRLGDVCSNISYGYTASAQQESSGIKFLRITDIVPEQINWDTVPYCLISDERINKYKLDVGDIVIARTGATTGYNKIIKKKINSVFASYLIRFKVNKTLADPFFVWYNLQSFYWKEFIKNIIGGSAQPGANAKQLASFYFSLPPLPEQKAIAEVLSSLDDKIELLQEQNKTLEEMAQTLFRKWFIDNPERKRWKKVRLGEVVSIKYGKNLPTKKLLPSGFPVFGGNGQIGFYNKYLYEKPQVLIACRGEKSGTVNISKPKSFITNNSLILEIKDSGRLTFEFLKYYALSTDFTNYISGSAQPQITIKDLSLAEIIIPPNTLISTFSKHITVFEESVLKNETQIQLLRELRDILLPKLISGEVRVKI